MGMFSRVTTKPFRKLVITMQCRHIGPVLYRSRSQATPPTDANTRRWKSNVSDASCSVMVEISTCDFTLWVTGTSKLQRGSASFGSLLLRSLLLWSLIFSSSLFSSLLFSSLEFHAGRVVVCSFFWIAGWFSGISRHGAGVVAAAGEAEGEAEEGAEEGATNKAETNEMVGFKRSGHLKQKNVITWPWIFKVWRFWAHVDDLLGFWITSKQDNRHLGERGCEVCFDTHNIGSNTW